MMKVVFERHFRPLGGLSEEELKIFIVTCMLQTKDIEKENNN